MRNSHITGASVLKRMINGLFISSLAVSIYASQTTQVAYQDVASLVGVSGNDRWLVHIQQPQGETIASTNAESLGKQKASLSKGSGTKTVLASKDIYKGAKPPRINRALKGGRVLQTTARQAPEKFSAGSVLERHSLLSPTDLGKKQVLAFVKPKPHKEALQVAAIFHPKKEKQIGPKTDHLPVMVAKLVKQSQSSILSYAPESKAEPSPFSAVLVEEQPIKIVPKLAKDDHKWADDPLPKNSFSKRQQACLARGIYFEARGESVKGQAAVAQVMLNRVRNPHYPNSICGVVYQNKHKYNRCQFSFACDRIRDRIKSPKLYKTAQHIAAETTANRIWLSEVGSSTHYHATYVSPRWRRSMKRLGKIGLHVFYRTYGGGWS